MLRLAGRHARLLKTPVLGRSPLLTARCFFTTQAGDEQDDGAKHIHWRTVQWEDKILPTLRTYKQMKGNILVPRPFVVPHKDPLWPKEMWGYRLGKTVNQVRFKLQKGILSTKLTEELETLNFAPDFHQFNWDEIIMPSLRRFYKLKGHTDVPVTFIVPTGDKTYPKVAWGWTLGSTLSSIRCLDAYAKQVAESRDELEKMEFCFTDLSEVKWNEKILPALEVYRRIFHHCIVEGSFVVPAELPWPEKSWGLILGVTVHNIRSGATYAQQSSRDRPLLDSLGFAWDAREAKWKERVVASLKIYKAQNGHCRVPSRFFVPSQDPWPRQAWGLNLGRTLYILKRQGSHFSYFGRDADCLDALGFNMRLSSEAIAKYVVPLLDTYKTVAGERNVPEDFVIPSEAPWPEKMWGVHLGIIVARNARLLI